MFRKITVVAVPAVAFALTLCASIDSASTAFAKGSGSGSGSSHGNGSMSNHHRGNDRDYRDRRYGRNWFGGYCWDYSCYGYFPTCAVVEPAPVVEVAPVVQAPVVVAPACTTCAPEVVSYDRGGYWGGRREFRHDRFGGREGHGGKK
jgi:hypothetical protein